MRDGKLANPRNPFLNTNVAQGKGSRWRWRTARNLRRVERQMLDNIIQAHSWTDRRHAWSVQKYGVCLKRPFFEWPSIVHHRWICGDGAERCMLCRCFTLELNRMPLPGSTMHKMCRYTLYTETTLRSNDHHLYLNSADRKGRDTDNNKMEQRSQELDWDMYMSCMHFHSLPSAMVIPVGSVFDPQNQVESSVWQEWSERARHAVWTVPTRCACKNTTCIQMLMTSEFCPLIFCLLVYITSCVHVRALTTHQIWTNGYRAHHRLRAYARWLHTCILQVICIEPSACCLSCEHSRAFPPLVYKAPTSWWSLIETKKQISGGGNFFGTMRKKIYPWRLC